MKAITTKYIGPTNTRGSRVRATDGDGNSVTLSWDSAGNSDDNHQAAAVALCLKMDWHGTLQEGTICKSGRSAGSVFVFLNATDQVEV